MFFLASHGPAEYGCAIFAQSSDARGGEGADVITDKIGFGECVERQLFEKIISRRKVLAAAPELTAQDVRSAFSDLIDVERVKGLQGKFAAVSFERA